MEESRHILIVEHEFFFRDMLIRSLMRRLRDWSVHAVETPEAAGIWLGAGLGLLITHAYTLAAQGRNYEEVARFCREVRRRHGDDLPIFALSKSSVDRSALREYGYPERFTLVDLQRTSTAELVDQVADTLGQMAGSPTRA